MMFAKMILKLAAIEKVPRVAASDSAFVVRTCGLSLPYAGSHAFPSTGNKSSGALLELQDSL